MSFVIKKNPLLLYVAPVEKLYVSHKAKENLYTEKWNVIIKIPCSPGY